MSKNIAIDVSQILYGTGVSNYTKNLITALLQIDTKNHYILFGGSLRRKSELLTQISFFKGNFEAKVTRISPNIGDIIWNRIHALPIEAVIGNIDVLHTSDWTEPKSKAYKVTTVHDLSPILFPKNTDPKIFDVFTRKLSLVKKETQKIIAPTQATKIDLIKTGFSESKIEVIYEALDPIYSKKFTLTDSTRDKYKIEGKYLLAVGTAPRKNLSNIIQAFIELKEKELVSNLVIVGSSKYSKINGVIYAGYVPDLNLCELYAGAASLVYASLYEGFGLPILEAFSQDTPVVTSNFSSMKEVSGGASILVDPLSVSSISEGIKDALKNKSRLVKKGKVRLADFSWEKTAQQTLDIYEQSK